MCVVAPVFAADDEAKKELEEKERLEALEEEKAEEKRTGVAFEPITLKGLISLNPVLPEETSNTVVGTFTTLKGEFQLKFESPLLRKELMAQNGKQVTLTGKVRNQAKYFVVMRVEVAPKKVKPVSRTSPGGL
jgi:hypothetical protein